MWDGFNKRKFPRLNLRCEISIHPDEKNAGISTITENVGVGGVCVILDQPLERFGGCRVRLELDDQTPEINCAGKVVWAVPTQDSASSPRRFDIGIEFVGLGTSERELLRKFLQERVQKGVGQ